MTVVLISDRTRLLVLQGLMETEPVPRRTSPSVGTEEVIPGFCYPQSEETYLRFGVGFYA
jgi:hypothetical protein